MRIGDRVSIIPSWSFGKAGEAGLSEHPSEEKATVVWIHPLGRFVVVKYDNDLREAFDPGEI